ncbi:type II secretion system F family protein [Loigolactobacillus coryniformis]|uniref:competence type IV pilus assembly protein ComGB n=1 Tax=Loigolactobacillus coryniformis TaxID=1610 RepID=UPI002340995C|nr:competence type IV pilus assembly protein ComGB [Loigolactobacillus coryniformis]MDC4186715.1 type II secretion system F family protein [Loigolactobacillus coryniformis]
MNRLGSRIWPMPLSWVKSIWPRSKRSLKGKQRQVNFQADFFSLLADLLLAGFSIAQSIQFMQVLLPQYAERLDQLSEVLRNGASLATGFQQIGIDQEIVNQIRITQEHGDLTDALTQIGQLLAEKLRQRQQLKRLLRYPLLLLSLVASLLLVVRYLIGPELRQWQLNLDNEVLLYWLAFVGLLILLLLVLAGRLLQVYLQRDPLKKAQARIHLPVLGKTYRYYYHYYLLFNLAILLKSGLNLQAICQLLKTLAPNSLLYCLGQQIEPQLEAGVSLNEIIRQQPILPAQLDLFVHKGRSLDHLSEELLMASHLTYKKMLASLAKLATYVQPLLFGIIALLIIGVYLSLLLPMYHMMEGLY